MYWPVREFTCVRNFVFHPCRYFFSPHLALNILGQELKLALNGWESRLLLASLKPDDLSYEIPVLRTLVRLFKKTPANFIDIGSHMGYFTCLIAKRFPNVHCFGFEIEPYLCRLGALNAELNQVSNITIIQSAVADCVGQLNYRIPLRRWKHPVLAIKQDKFPKYRSLSVSAIAIDDYCSHFLPGLSVIKMDIEGSEMAALKGATRFLQEKSPLLVIEIHRRGLRLEGSSVEAVYELLHSFGYILFEILNFRVANEEPQFSRVTDGYVSKSGNSMIVAVKPGDEGLLLNS